MILKPRQHIKTVYRTRSQYSKLTKKENKSKFTDQCKSINWTSDT